MSSYGDYSNHQYQNRSTSTEQLKELETTSPKMNEFTGGVPKDKATQKKIQHFDLDDVFFKSPENHDNLQIKKKANVVPHNPVNFKTNYANAFRYNQKK